MKWRIMRLCVGLALFGCSVCQAAPEIVLEKVIYDVKDTQGKEIQNTLNINWYAHWEWLEMDFANKFAFPEESFDYSAKFNNSKLIFTFPKLAGGLGIDFDCNWNSRYQNLSAGLDYAWKPMKGLKVQCEADAGSRTAVVDEAEPYRYDWDYQKVSLGYNLGNWSYKLGCDRNQKRYPETAYYTSTRVNLEEELARQLSPKFKLGVTYRESIGDYPYDTSLTRNFWKEEWAVWGKFKQAKNKHWDWKYRTLVWERGFDLYQDNTYLSADYQCWTKRLRFDAAISWSELNYPSEMISDDPDEEVDEGDDYKSRDEQKLSLELTRYFDTVQWGFEIFAVRKDYTYGAAVSRSGLIGKIIWEVGKFKIRLNLAPWGNASSESDYYQIKLEYNPKDVIE